MLSMGLQSQYYKIENIYSKVSVKDTLKILIRNKLLFIARWDLFKIFKNVKEYTILRNNLDQE